MVKYYSFLLENSFSMINSSGIFGDYIYTRHGYLSNFIFNFTLYDSELDEIFSKKAVEVCEAISSKSTFDYIKDNRVWYMAMVNMPFFLDKISWSTSIREAWWEDYTPNPNSSDFFLLKSDGIFEETHQIINLKIDRKRWPEFIDAIIKFAQT